MKRIYAIKRFENTLTAYTLGSEGNLCKFSLVSWFDQSATFLGVDWLIINPIIDLSVHIEPILLFIV